MDDSSYFSLCKGIMQARVSKEVMRMDRGSGTPVFED